MSKNFEAYRKELLKLKEEYEMKEIIKNLDARKAIIKEKSKLTKQVKKAGKQAPGGLDCFKEENMYHSEKDISRYLEDTSYMDAYHASKLDSEWN
jgi:hypothetical protein